MKEFSAATAVTEIRCVCMKTFWGLTSIEVRDERDLLDQIYPFYNSLTSAEVKKKDDLDHTASELKLSLFVW